MENAEEAQLFIEQTQQMLNSPEGFEGLISSFTGMWGKVQDFESFKTFFTNYLRDRPNPKIVEGVDIEAEAVALWSRIDVNKSGSLDADEERLIVTEIMKHGMELVRKYFNLA